MKRNFRKRIKNTNGSMRGKIALSLGAIAVVLLISSTISVLEYSRMSNYVTDLISGNVKCINVTQNLSKMCEGYNLQVLNAIRDDRLSPDMMPEMDEAVFLAGCDSIRMYLSTNDAKELVDSVVSSYYTYVITSSQLVDVIDSDFINTRGWYFSTLEPEYDLLRADLSEVARVAYGQLQGNSETFQQGFYRSIVPGMVSAGVGLLLVVLLAFYLSVYYVNPVYKMLKNLKNSILAGTKYRVAFEGNDQLSELNDNITEVVDENVELRRRLRMLSEENESLKEAVRAAEE